MHQKTCIVLQAKNDQKIYIVPNKHLVIVRMGEAGDTENFALSGYDNQLWTKINALINQFSRKRNLSNFLVSLDKKLNF